MLVTLKCILSHVLSAESISIERKHVDLTKSVLLHSIVTFIGRNLIFLSCRTAKKKRFIEMLLELLAGVSVYLQIFSLPLIQFSDNDKKNNRQSFA